MDTRWIKLCFLLISCAELSGLADSASVEGLLDPSPAVVNNPHTIKCNFQLLAGESFEGLLLYLGTSIAQEAVVATMRQSGSVGWTSDVPTNLEQRGYLLGSKDDGYMHLVINSTECGDKDKQYRCSLVYYIGDTKQPDETVTISSLSQLQAAPQTLSEMTRNPVEDTVMEHTNMTFQCSGNVGRPAGTFRWYKFIGTGSEAGEEVTSQADQDNEVPSGDGCTYTRVSRLTLNLTRTEVNEKLVVRCRLEQALVDSGQTGCTEENFCRMSPEINVQYPVRVSVTSDTVSASEGSDLSVVCMTHGNPAPSTPEWQREGENTTTVGETLTLSSVSLDDSGIYVCTAYNTINNVQFNHSIAVNVVIQETTTAPPTTTTTSATTVTTTKGEQIDKGGSDDTTTIIIVVVVVVVVVVIIAIVAVVFVLRRRRKAKEVAEPPEKPINNNAGINSASPRPDLVRSSYDNGPPYKNEDGLGYAELQFDNKPRSRRPLAIDDSHTDYSDVSMPQV